MPDENPHLKDWIDRATADGLTGEVTVGGQTKLGELYNVVRLEIGDKTLEDASSIPVDMAHRTAEIFAERDRLANNHVFAMKSMGAQSGYCQEWADWMDQHPDDPQWPALHKILLPKAIENVRAKPEQVRLLTAIPRELTPHILTIMAERDRILMDEEAANGPYNSEADLVNARNAALLSAIETMRAALEVKIILAERGIEPENLSFCSDQYEIAEEAKRRVAKRTTKEESDGQAS